MEKIVITGINGFVGHHLAKKLKDKGLYSIIGVDRAKTLSERLIGVVDEYHSANLIENWPSLQNIKSIIHLAGLAAVKPSFDNPQGYINGNTAMLTNLCEYYLKQPAKPRIIAVSSGLIYDPNQKLPIDESGTIGFNSPYAVSKIANENQAKYYRNRGLEIITARPFNHVGPGQKEGFLIPDLYTKIFDLPKGKTVIKTGNLATKRDYTDVRDVARAYVELALANTVKHDLYNICSGKSIAGADILKLLTRSMRREEVAPEMDPGLMRPNDIMDIHGDNSLIREDMGWKPEITIEQTINDFVVSQG